MLLKMMFKYIKMKSLGNKNHCWPQIVTIIIATLGGLTSSAQYTWPSPSIPQLISNSSKTITLTLEEVSYFSVIPPIGTLIAGAISGGLIDLIGRKKMILLLSVPHILAWALIIVSTNLSVFYISRFLSGISDGILFCVVPAYVGEISTPNVRGTWGNFITIYIYLGQFLINLVGSYFDVKTTAWIFLIFPVVHVILFAFLPESPYYLLAKNRKSEAEASLKLLRWNNDVQKELNAIEKDVLRQTSESGTLKDLFCTPTNRKALLISVTLRTCQTFSGLPAFAVYTQYIFYLAEGSFTASTSAIIYTGVLFITSVGWSFFVDYFGRRPLMVISSFGCAVALFIEGTYFYLMLETSINLTSYNWIPLAGMLLYIVMCSSGLGILPTLMLSELFSASVKGKAAGVVTVVFSLYILIVPKLFQLLTTHCGMYLPFFVFCFCTILSTLFSYFFVPETRRKTLEEIQQSLTKRKSDNIVESNL